MKVELVSITPEAENIISYCARVSNPSNQENYNTAPKLLAHCIKNNHWSIFEMANVALEIETGRDIAPQLLRHKSFSFQEFSLRYTTADLGYQQREARRQDTKNRQNSIDDLPEETKQLFREYQHSLWDSSNKMYEYFLSLNVAKECARAILPLNTTTRLYVNGNIRSWITYCLVRCEKSTQLEHREIANECWKILRAQLPIITKAVEEVYPEIFKDI